MVFVMIWIVLLNWFSGTFAQTETTFNIQNFLNDFEYMKTKLAKVEMKLNETETKLRRMECEKYLTVFEASLTNIHECIIQVVLRHDNNEPTASFSSKWNTTIPPQSSRKNRRSRPTRPPVTTLIKEKGSKHPATPMLFDPKVKDDTEFTYMKSWFQNARHHVCHKAKCMKSDRNFFTDEMDRLINSTTIAYECEDEKLNEYLKSEDLEEMITLFEMFKTKYTGKWKSFTDEENRKLVSKQWANISPTVEK